MHYYFSLVRSAEKATYHSAIMAIHLAELWSHQQQKNVRALGQNLRLMQSKTKYDSLSSYCAPQLSW